MKMMSLRLCGGERGKVFWQRYNDDSSAEFLSAPLTLICLVSVVFGGVVRLLTGNLKLDLNIGGRHQNQYLCSEAQWSDVQNKFFYTTMT